jgi:hypothetical protein
MCQNKPRPFTSHSMVQRSRTPTSRASLQTIGPSLRLLGGVATLVWLHELQGELQSCESHKKSSSTLHTYGSDDGPRTCSIAAAVRSTIKSTSSRVTLYGGASWTMSPSRPFAMPVLGIRDNEWSCKATACTVGATFCSAGNGALVALSFTNSTCSQESQQWLTEGCHDDSILTPQNSPRPRTSPTCW